MWYCTAADIDAPAARTVYAIDLPAQVAATTDAAQAFAAQVAAERSRAMLALGAHARIGRDDLGARCLEIVVTTPRTDCAEAMVEAMRRQVERHHAEQRQAA